MKNAVISSKLLLQDAESTELAVMDQRDKMFDPHVLVVQQGSQVSFPNSDNIRHHVYSFSRPKKFEIRLYSGEPSSPVLFDTPGVVVLGCNIHDSMLGYIYVAAGPVYALSDDQGRLQLEFSEEPSADTQFQLWHPLLNRHNRPLEMSYREISQNNYLIRLELDLGTVTDTGIERIESPLEKRFRELRQLREKP